MKTKKEYECMATLRSVLSESENRMRIVHPHQVWFASFEWANPVSLTDIRKIENELNIELPEDYVVFLTTVSNGTTLFYDTKYGQWGYKIYSTGEIIDEQRKWRQLCETDWESTFFVVGELIGEGNVIVMDLKKPTKDKKGCELKDGSVIDPPSYWPKMSRSFHEWLENLITAQGAKYWLWN